MDRFLNGRLSILARLMIVCAAFLAPIGLLSVLYVSQVLKDIRFSEKELGGAAYIGAIWPGFMESVQGREVRSLAADPALDARFASGEVSAKFAQSTGAAQVDAGVAFIGGVADGSNLTLDPDLDSFYAMDAAMVELPKLAAAIAASARSSDPTSLAVAQSHISVFADAAQSSLAAAMKNDRSGAATAALRLRAQALDIAMNRYTEALHNGAADISAARAAALAELNTVHSADLQQLQRMLRARIADLQTRLWTSLGAVALALAVAGCLAIAISGGLARRLSELMAAMDRLIAKDSSVSIPHLLDQNETGRIAETLEAFRRELIAVEAVKSEQDRVERQKNEAVQSQLSAERDMQAALGQVVSDLNAALARLARGDLTVRLHNAFPKGYEEIRAAFNTSVAKLEDALCAIAGTGGEIRSEAEQLSAAADELSSRTEQQAASLEETAAALGQITATVQKTSDDARSARAAVAATRADAEESREIVRKAVMAMKAIEATSGHVTQIVGVIDEIAFQTNLLALNAGVEAARAGDSGRGFAVVAQEVRALAQRSADAAKEIRTLISESSREVSGGVKLVVHTGDALEKISDQVRRVAAVVTDITSSAEEQATALHQINQAVNDMDQITQQNAAMVEETTAASHALTDQVESFARLMAQFRIGVVGAPGLTDDDGAHHGAAPAVEARRQAVGS